MTMLVGMCEVCFVNKPIGVACTSIPLSVAYCKECATRGADPEIVFVCWFDDFGTDFDNMAGADVCTTYKDGQYMTYREWATKYGPELAKRLEASNGTGAEP